MIIRELEKKANYIRDEVIRVAVKNNVGHIAPSLSTVDILVALYYKIMQPFSLQDASGKHYALDNRSIWQHRDRLILSKGHGCYALYAILADLGVMPQQAWEHFNIPRHIGDLVLNGCVEYCPEFGLEASTGSLGHGLPMAVGMAFAAKKQKKNYKVYCIIGDGECQEGTTWESIEFACHHYLNNLVVIVDANKKQAMSNVPYTPYDLEDRFCAFGADAQITDGHDIESIIQIINSVCVKHVPKVLIARTVKGKGLKCMEDQTHFHYRVPTEEELRMGRTYE